MRDERRLADKRKGKTHFANIASFSHYINKIFNQAAKIFKALTFSAVGYDDDGAAAVAQMHCQKAIHINFHHSCDKHATYQFLVSKHTQTDTEAEKNYHWISSILHHHHVLFYSPNIQFTYKMDAHICL